MMFSRILETTGNDAEVPPSLDFVQTEDTQWSVTSLHEEQHLIRSDDGSRHVSRALSETKATPRRFIFASAVGLVALAVLCLGTAILRLAPSGEMHPKKGGYDTTSLAQDMCAGLDASCASSKCCKTGGERGYQCYAKSADWAQCMESCEPGVHEGEKDGTYDAMGKFHPAEWSCDKLGNRSAPDPCSAPGDNCKETKCCSSASGGSGMTCFEKNEHWASCQDTCDDKDWSCKALGERTPWPAGCAWAGASCADERLCCNRGFVCAKKDDSWTGCAMTAKSSTWATVKIPLPAGWNGTIYGGSRNEYSVPGAPAGEAIAGMRLYCFMAFMPDSYEVGLYKVAKASNASIFACDLHDVFHSWRSAKSGWDTGEATLTNTDVFIDVWKHMLKSGKYMDADWTVKVDADAIVFPGRLRSHLTALRPPANRPIYIKNNAIDKGLGNNGFLGAVEVFSRQAIQIYSDNQEGCHKSLGVQSGEDGFFKGCMDALGVGFMTDPQLFNPDRSPGICNNKDRAAFHPLKSPKNWQCCLDIVNGINRLVKYGECEMKDPLLTLKMQ